MTQSYCDFVPLPHALSSQMSKKYQSLNCSQGAFFNQAVNVSILLEIYILDILAQCNRPKPNPVCTSSLGFSRLYILMLWLIVTHVIVLHSYT